jgi:signal peptidase I
MYLRKKMNKSNLKKIFVITIFSFGVVYLFNFSGVFIYNETNSLPIGYYIVDKDISIIDKGDIIRICPREDNQAIQLGIERGYLTRTNQSNCFIVSLLKVVAAREGDFIECRDNEVLINKTSYRKQLEDSQKRGLPSCDLNRKLKKNEYFVMTEKHNSFDSRYLGVVKREEIMSKAKPFLTWSNE